MNIERRYFKVIGRVQNVGFRWTVQHLANPLGVTGWVRNCRDGSVEMELQGSAGALNKIIGTLKDGQTFIRIDDCICRSLPPVSDEKDFTVRF